MADKSDFVLWPDQVLADSPVGGKARALADLTGAGLQVPEWFVVVPVAFDQSLSRSAAAALAGAADSGEIQAALAELHPATSVQDAIAKACARLGSRNDRYAVRSSAREEDGAAHSFAGQLESYLSVAPEAVADRVAAVWRSGFSERILAYRRQAGLPALPGAPAVVVQRMVAGEVSGVAFSADPVSGRRGIAVVNGLPGLGSALVSGEASADAWRVDRDDRIVDRVIAEKRVIHQSDPDSPEGSRTAALPPDEARRPSLDDELVVAVARLARAAERHFSRPQDIEWTFAGDRLYLLQSRPITGLADMPDPDGCRAIWDNSNIAESYNGITTPFTFSFARRAYEHVYRQFCRLMGLDEAAIEARADMFCCMLGLINGRVYYNLFNWYRLVAVLPGYTFNRKFMEQMMGVRESLGDELAAALEPSTPLGRWRDGARLLVTLVGLVRSILGLNRRIRRFYKRLADTLGPGRPDLSRLRADELVFYYRQLEQKLLMHWDAPILNDFATMLFHGMLRRLVGTWVGDAQGSLQNDLLSADEGMISSEPARRVRHMARLASASPALVTALCEEGLKAIQAAMAGQPAFVQAYADYLGRFGDRCMEELKLESPTLHDDPLPLLRAVGQYARHLREQGGQEAERPESGLRHAAEARVAQALAGHPLRRVVFNRVLAAARNHVRDRENLRFERTRVFGRARLIAVEIGKRLAALERLESARDIFWLEVDEMLAFVDGRASSTALKGLVSLRKAEYARYREGEAPAERFETRGVVYVGNRFQSPHPHAVPTGEAMQGLGCCAGVVRGPVRIIRDPRRASVAQGEIIVAERTDPGWVMIFPAAAGLLVERGSLLSHSAIVARELNLPTIVALDRVTAWLRDGDWVEMDGASGRVTRIAASDRAEPDHGGT